MPIMQTRVCGVVLAAGAGTRFGGPKALAHTEGGEPWVARAVRALEQAGCTPIFVMLGAAAAQARALVPSAAQVVEVPHWAAGLSATVRAGLKVAGETDAVAALIVPVDVPDLSPVACRRMADRADTACLRRAVYAGEPGHPVLIGRDHYAAAAAAVTGDSGAAAYLAVRGVDLVECGDLWHGADVDERETGTAQGA